MDMKGLVLAAEELSSERGVPNNVRTMLQEAVVTLGHSGPKEEKLSSVISILDEATNDPNVSPYVRTRIWNLVSSVEEMMKS